MFVEAASKTDPVYTPIRPFYSKRELTKVDTHIHFRIKQRQSLIERQSHVEIITPFR